jgi:predicted O-methyltransferase YrrM
MLEPKVELRLCPDDNDYVSQALTFDDNSVDFCLIDGAKRDYWTLYMLPKLRKGGILVLDNANLFLPNDSKYSPNSRRMKEGFSTETWQQFAEQASKFRRILTSNGVWDTVIWIKC